MESLIWTITFIFHSDYISNDFNVEPLTRQRKGRSMSVFPGMKGHNVLSERRISIAPEISIFKSKCWLSDILVTCEIFYTFVWKDDLDL